MARPVSRSALDSMNMVMAARRHYLEHATKSVIADELGISRFKVARLLDEAVARGVVTFQIHSPADVDLDLSLAIASSYGLRQALVLNLPDGPEPFRRDQLGRASAAALGTLIEEGDVVGVSWGRTLHAMVTSLPALARCTVVQIVGSIPSSDLSVSSLDLARTMAERAGGEVRALQVPMVVDSADTAARLREDPFVAQTLASFDRLDRAVVSVGAWREDQSALVLALPPDLRASIAAEGACADICSTILDADGQLVGTALQERSISISTAQLRAVPDVTAVVGGGEERGPAIHAALRSGLIHRLVTDTHTARALTGLTT